MNAILEKYTFDKIYYTCPRERKCRISTLRLTEKYNQKIVDTICNKYKNIHFPECDSIPVTCDTKLNNIHCETLVNISEPFSIGDSSNGRSLSSQKDGEDLSGQKNGDSSDGREIIVVAVDHFMSRSAIHSHILFIDADKNVPYHMYFTGIVSRKININCEQTIHVINSKPPKHVKRVIVVEKIFYDPDNGSCPHVDTIVPMSVYVK